MRLLVTKWFGALLLEDGRVTQRADFPPNAHDIASRLQRMRNGEVLEEERSLARPGLMVLEERLKSLGKVVHPDDAVNVPPPTIDERLLHEAAMLVARDESRTAAAQPDRFVVQSVRALDEVVKTSNTLMERLRDWYALHYPEALRATTDPQQLASALAESPDRARIAARFKTTAAPDSIGSAFDERELAAVQAFARTVLGLFQERSRLEPLIEKETRQVAPTLSGLVGPLVAARLIALANGLERLAFVPSGTLQTFGAEEAVFAHLKERARPPKHGVLFQNPVIHTAPMHQRGRISRSLANLATLAARLDHFHPGTDQSAPLRARFETKLQAIRSRPARRAPPAHRGPPPRQGGPPRHYGQAPARERKPDRKPFLPRGKR